MFFSPRLKRLKLFLPKMEENYQLEKMKNGKKQIWNATMTNLDEKTHLKCTWGQDGRKMQIRERTYVKGKVNRTSWEQARLECTKMIKDKMRKGYVLHPKSSQIIIDEDDEVDEKNVRVPHVMLAHNMEKYPEMYENEEKGAHIMPKLDGIFCVADLLTGELWSRQRVPILGLPHIEEAVTEMGIHSVKKEIKWIVGELYRHGWEFNKISGMIRGAKTRENDEKKEIEFHVFDAILPEEPFLSRYSFLKNLTPSAKGEIKIVEAIYVPSLYHSHKTMHKKFTEMGYEGIMIHCDGGPGYEEDKRTKWLLKYKTFEQEEFICVRVNPMKHEDKDGHLSAGSVLVEDRNRIRFSATPKWTQKEKKKLWTDREKFVGKYATVTFFSKSDKGIPRFPILIGFRSADDM